MSKSHFLILAVLVFALTVPGCSKNKRTSSDSYPVAVEKDKRDIPAARTRADARPARQLPVRPTRSREAGKDALAIVYFDFDRSNIRPDQRAILDRNKAWLAGNPRSKVVIEGHCDERGTKEYNFALGERRANSVRDYLILMGIDGARLAVVSKGEDEPMVKGTGERAYARNRRAQFRIMDSRTRGESRTPARTRRSR